MPGTDVRIEVRAELALERDARVILVGYAQGHEW